ncbi:GspH/FimT family pseudopilin [Polaromonas sp. YR568]|uniref:GspH/FimT family pseudopilin n=1 Tax=Polaromonas sp. YR568 TaxID=1855301 RepID=UPI001587D4EA|nr:GspH/FimT family pseudopilin [Polaromonas sp. YR568]
MNGQPSPAIALAHCSRSAPLPAGPRARERGFTIIELMVVVAIVGILAGLAAPSFSDLLRRNRLASASSALQVSLSLARSEAVKRGSDARVTVAANGTAGVWTNGWTVFVDKTTTANAGVGPTADSGTVTRLEVAGVPSLPVSTAQTGTLKYFSYNGQGRLIDVSGAAVVDRSFWFFDGTSQKYCLVINNTGRVRTTRVEAAQSCPTN